MPSASRYAACRGSVAIAGATCRPRRGGRAQSLRQAHSAGPDSAYSANSPNSISGGLEPTSTNPSGTSSRNANGTRRFRLKSLKLRYGKRLTISRPAAVATTKASISPRRPSRCNSFSIQMKPASNAAADGLGRPSKKRLSAVAERALKRASRIAAQAA